jgi:ubiquinone/menaquinone biosynthesis C-methylase UbiE
MTMTNLRNREIYRQWAKVYDALVEGVSRAGRERALAMARFVPGQRVLLVGVGTGIDLALLPAGVRAIGVDLSPEMLAHARARLPLPDREVALALADVARLPLADASCDAAVLDLILSVVPAPREALAEVLRVVRPGGALVAFDKFLPAGARPGPVRRALNALTTRLGTDINRRLADIVDGLPCTVERDEAAALGGVYRAIALRRT